MGYTGKSEMEALYSELDLWLERSLGGDTPKLIGLDPSVE